MTNRLPQISVIIPTFNEEKRIKKCLDSIIVQNYPKSYVEILIIDDGSTDRTLQIARKYRAKIFYNGTHNIERGKSIGLEKAKGKYVFFIDADNILTNKNWFSYSIELLEKDKKLVGVQSSRFLYKVNHSPPNRYCELFGVNDPFVFYLKKRGLLAEGETDWLYPQTLVSKHKHYFIVRFSTHNLPTFASQGYMTRKSFLKQTNWKPYLFHMDSTYDLVKKEKNKFAVISYAIEHDYAESFTSMFTKLKRNIRLFLQFQGVRRYKYETSRLDFVKAVVFMSTFIIPIIDASKGFAKKPDWVWFMHPIICFSVVVLYSYETLKFKMASLFGK